MSKAAPTCTGIVVGGECDPASTFPVPADGSSAFFTTWSLFAVLVSSLLLLVALILKACFPFKLGTYMWVVLGLLAMPAVNSVGVLWASQLLLALNLKLSTDDPQDMHSISQPLLGFITSVNFKSHILPGLIGVLTLLACPKPRTNRTRCVFGLALVVFLVVFVGLWMAVPATTSDDNQVFGIDKINYVYNNPPLWIFGTQVVVALLVIALLAWTTTS